MKWGESSWTLHSTMSHVHSDGTAVVVRNLVWVAGGALGGAQTDQVEFYQDGVWMDGLLLPHACVDPQLISLSWNEV